MSLSIPIHPNPFRFLLYTEWGLLATCALADCLWSVVFSQPSYVSVLPLLILAPFALMGLVLPTSSTIYKLLYTSIEIGLIIFGAAVGCLQLWPVLLIIVVIRSCFLFDLSGRRLLAGLIFVLFLVMQIQSIEVDRLSLPLFDQGEFWLHQMTNTLLFGMGLLFVLQLVNTVLRERQMREQLIMAHEQLHQYAQQIEDLAAVQERNRMAHDIHDSLGHALTALNVQLQSALKFWQVDPDQAQKFVAQSKQLGSMAMQEVRCSVSALRADLPERSPLQLPCKDTTIKESFVSQCQRDLAHVIGPIAIILVEKTLKSSPHLSPRELVQKLAAEIADAKKANEFEQRLLS